MLQQAVEWQRVGPQPGLRQLLSCSSSVCIADERLDVAPVLQPQCALTSHWTMPQLPGERPRLAPCLESLAVHGEQPAALRAALCSSTLLRLDLTCNRIGNEGARGLAAGVEKNRSLRHLHLDGNQLGDAGAAALCDALRSNAGMRRCTLYLTANPLSSHGKAACRRAAAAKPTPFKLSLL